MQVERIKNRGMLIWNLMKRSIAGAKYKGQETKWNLMKYDKLEFCSPHWHYL